MYDIVYEKGFDGAWLLATVILNRRVWRKYYGYTKREATSLFRRYIKELRKNA